MRLIILVLGLMAAIAANFAGWYLPNRPLAMDRPWLDGPITSLSFAPFRRGQSPLTRTYPTAAEIESDLKSLQGLAHGVRTYTSQEGMEIVPELAGKYGLTVIQSAWLGVEKPVNDAEVAALIDQANRHPDSIKRVIVGNEVLLRKDLPVDALAAYIRKVRQSIKQPVSYADVWEFWLKNPELAKDVDFITVHFLPYWEDFPIGVDGAMEHILAVRDIMQKAFPDKPILIGEVGWPSGGRDREKAVPSRSEEARFVNAFLNLARDKGLDYNLVEAFDQPWKAKLEGTVGARWGILDIDRQPKFRLGQPVVENPDWAMAFGGSTLLGLVLLLTGYAGMRDAPSWRLFGTPLLTQLLATLLTIDLVFTLSHSFSRTDWVVHGLRLLLQAGLAWLLLRTALQPDRRHHQRRSLAASFRDFKEFGGLYLPLGNHTVSADKLKRFALGKRQWLLEWLLALFAFWALYESLMLALAGRDLGPLIGLKEFRLSPEWIGLQAARYRDFPIAEFLVPSFGALATRLFTPLWGGTVPATQVRAEWRLVILMIVALAITMAVEKPSNLEAWAWLFVALLTALPHLVTLLGSRLRPA